MKTPRYTLLLAAVMAAFSLAAGAGTSTTETSVPSAVPAQFDLPDDFYPESIAADSRGVVYVSSFRQGAVARLLPGQTQASVFISTGSNGLVSAQGLVTDEARNTLWVCSGDFGYSTAPPSVSALKSFDLQTGAPKASYPLPGGGYCNDMVLDSKGTLYVTDSIHPRVLRLSSGSASLEVWAQGKALAAGKIGLTLNGIALDRDDTLYISKVDAEPYLIKIAIKSDGTADTPQTIEFPRPLHRVDGLRLLAHGQLALFENDVGGSQSAISVADVTTDKATLRTLADASVASLPSSGVTVGTRLYYLESKFAQLFAFPAKELHQLPVGVHFSVKSIQRP